MNRLLSKIVAGGLSAAVILLWWPLVFPSDTVESWLVRGILWTLCFELMLHAFAPLEEALWRSRAARQVVAQASAAGAKLGPSPEAGRRHARAVVAAVALVVPVALLATAPAHRLAPRPAAASVRHVTEVKRVVRVERRRVTVPRADGAAPVAAGAAPQVAGTTVGAPARPAARPLRRGARPIAPRRAAGRRSAGAGNGSSGNGSRSSTGADTTTPTPVGDSPAGSGSGGRTATTPVAQPKQRVAVARQ